MDDLSAFVTLVKWGAIAAIGTFLLMIIVVVVLLRNAEWTK